MNTLIKLSILVVSVAILGGCNFLTEQHNSTTNAPVPLYAYFETASTENIGCYPQLETPTDNNNNNNNNNNTVTSSMRAMYDFYITSQYEVTVCVKIPAEVLSDASVALSDKTIRFMATNTNAVAGTVVGTDAYTIPNATTTPLKIMGTTLSCPSAPYDIDSKLVGTLSMENFTQFAYITAIAESCGMVAGTATSPYAASTAVYGGY